MGVIAEFAERVLVMYAGRIAEEGPVEGLMGWPRHPYTIGLLASTPDLEREAARLRTIPGGLPNLAFPPPGCRFAPRCDRAIEDCTRGRPPLIAVEAAHSAACIRVDAVREPA
jgi:oligopeptide/dipeptide ABC transporter ATP-binding protein